MNQRNDTVVTKTELRLMFNVSEPTINRLVRFSDFPRPVKFDPQGGDGTRWRYLLSEVLDWLKARRVARPRPIKSEEARAVLEEVRAGLAEVRKSQIGKHPRRGGKAEARVSA